MATMCEVCASPSANTLHFGGRTCKACAAFFRRTVSMNMDYRCVNGGPSQCKIHYELRMICRQCRFLKCLRAGMKREMVQAKGERSSPKEQPKAIKTEPSSVESLRSPADCQPSTSGPSPNGPTPPCGWGALLNEYFYRSPSMDSVESEGWKFLEHYLHMEASLNDRRRIMYTNAPIRVVFHKMSECPYELQDLRPFNYRKYEGFNKHDFIMLYDFCKTLPGFDDLCLTDKTVLYRSCCAVDCMIVSYWYSYRLGRSKSHLVLFNGEYLPMDPLPISGLEQGAESLFSEKADFESYKNIMPIKIRQWLTMALPLCELELTFEEYCLLKILTIWHFSYYHLSGMGKEVCEQQRDQALRTLHLFCQERDSNPADRIGNIIMAMSSVLEQVHELTNSIVLITFFDIVKMDNKVTEILNQDYNET